MSSIPREMENGAFKENPSDKLIQLHIWFQFISPFAVIGLLLYVVGTLFYDPADNIVLGSRIFLSTFFGLEVLVEFVLYKSKKDFIKNYWWRALLVVPVVGFLRIIGQLAQLSQLLSVVKMTEKALDSIQYFVTGDEKK